MKILIFGAGAIGSLFGGFLSKNNDVVFIARKEHVEQIKNKGLFISGKTNLKLKLNAYEDISSLKNFEFDLIILSVKSFDTIDAIKKFKPLIKKNTYVMSLQNGLDNIEKISNLVKEDKILVCITTHGAVFSKPGFIIHTGIGKTKIGSIKNDTKVSEKFADLFEKADIKTKISENVLSDIWVKGIVNSSINPLTCFFKCKNGYLLENPVLKNLVEKICYESTMVAKSEGFLLNYEEMIKTTKEVIIDTSENFSSMLQSVLKSRETEVDSINGFIVKTGRKHNVNVNLNTFLLKIVKDSCY